jgi:hypothetical protein
VGHVGRHQDHLILAETVGHASCLPSRSTMACAESTRTGICFAICS